MERLPLETQTLYAELMEALTAQEAHRSLGLLSGCFVEKTVKGEPYLYFQCSEPGGHSRQVYLGKKSPSLKKVIERFQDEKESFNEDKERIKRLSAQLRAGGALTTDSATARVLHSFAGAGFFSGNAVLVGTHAFSVLGNMLGVRWAHAAIRTQDIALADPPVGLAVPSTPVDVPQILDGLEMGFLPVLQLNPKQASTSFKVRGKGLRVDLITPQQGGPGKKMVVIPHLNAAAQPLAFLDFLIENPEKGAVVNGGAILVHVPSPARFAFHKLIVSRERSPVFHAKVEKDLLQAAQVFEALAEERPGDLILAWEDLKHRGGGWTKRVEAALQALKKKYSQIHEATLAAVPELARM